MNPVVGPKIGTGTYTAKILILIFSPFFLLLILFLPLVFSTGTVIFSPSSHGGHSPPREGRGVRYNVKYRPLSPPPLEFWPSVHRGRVHRSLNYS